MPSEFQSIVLTRKHKQLAVSVQVALLTLSCFLPFSVEAKSPLQKKKSSSHGRSHQVATSKHSHKSQTLVAKSIGSTANKLFSSTQSAAGLGAVAPNWDLVAADLLKYCQPMAGYSQSLREMIDSATNNSAHIAKAPEVPAALKLAPMPKAPELVKTPEILKAPAPTVVIVPAAAPTAIPQVNRQEFKESYTEPSPLAVDRLDTIEKLDAKAVAKDERRNRSRKRLAMKDDTKSSTNMRIVPPMPAMKMKNKENPFIDANINFTRPLMLGVPH